MKSTNQIICENIKDLLRINNKSQSDLAKYLGLPRQTVSRIINGERELKIDELEKTAIFLNATIDSLIKIKEKIHLSKTVILYHGSNSKIVNPKYLGGSNTHDYGNGFYLSLNEELAKEWAVCNSQDDGYLHKYKLDTSGLKILYLNEKYNVLTWLAVLAKHRSADNTKKYKVNVEKLIAKYYYKEIDKYDIIVGYRADDSYFSFAKHAIKNEIDISLLELIMRTGDLGHQVFIKSKKAFEKLKEIEKNSSGYYMLVNHDEYFRKYDERDHLARNQVYNMINSDLNTLNDTLENYLD